LNKIHRETAERQWGVRKDADVGAEALRAVNELHRAAYEKAQTQAQERRKKLG
jgi:hypothetical protein